MSVLKGVAACLAHLVAIATELGVLHASIVSVAVLQTLIKAQLHLGHPLRENDASSIARAAAPGSGQPLSQASVSVPTSAEETAPTPGYTKDQLDQAVAAALQRFAETVVTQAPQHFQLNAPYGLNAAPQEFEAAMLDHTMEDTTSMYPEGWSTAESCVDEEPEL